MNKLLLISFLALAGILSSCTDELTEKEQLFVGSWRLQNYESNETIPESERANYELGINNLKSRFRLILLDDLTFLRDGFAANTESGDWFINNEGTLLSLKSQDQGGTIFIESITENNMVLSVEEGDIRVKMTLLKVGE